ncbi:MAG: RluA family pseudouridine synthase [Sandaracinaceae bacterium]
MDPDTPIRSASEDAEAPTETYVVSSLDEGKRLDQILTRHAPERSRATYQRWIQDGRVHVDGVPAQSKRRPRVGQTLEVRPAPPPRSEAIPQDLPLDVLYEDSHLVVVNKAAGMVVHPAPGHPDGTLVNAVLHHFGWLPGDEPDRPGIVHRLDAQTSGVMLVARSEEAKARLVEMFAAHDLERAYVALVRGRLDGKTTYDTMHARHPRDRKRFSSKVSRGKRAVTYVEALESLHGATRVRCTLETGRTHQIRVHLADATHPLIGDPVYARVPRDPRLAEVHRALGRQALHAAVLGFAHPVTGEAMRFEVDPPDDFISALDALRDAQRRG